MKSSGFIASIAATRKRPALFTMMSGAPPNSCRRRFPAAATDCRSVMSHSTAIADCPSPRATSSSSGLSRDASATRPPAFASCRAISAPIPFDAPVTIAVRPASSVTGLACVGKSQKLIPRLRVVPEDTAKRRRYCLRVLLLNAPHHHAEVIRLDHNSHAERIENLADRLGDLVGQPLLHLETLRKDIHDSRQLGETDDSSVGDVCDVRLSVERQHVVLAERVQLDVAHHHHVFVRLLEQRVADHFPHVLLVTPCEPGER